MIKELVSVIVPAYNCEKTINRCLDSILNQTYDRIELIVVNDGSTDNTLNILEQYRSRIVLINQENCGASTARNAAIKVANGELLTFVDSDDSIPFDYIDRMITYAAKYDLIVGGLTCIGNAEYSESFDLIVDTDDEIANLYDNEKLIPLLAAPVAKLFKKQIIIEHKINFIESLSLGEDTCFVLDYLQYTKNIRFIEDAYYYVYMHDNSLSRTNYAEIWDIQLIINSHYDSFILSHDRDRIKDDGGVFYYRSVRIALNTAIYFRWNRKEFRNLCDDILKSNILDKIKRPKSIYQRIIYDCLKNGHYSYIMMVLRLKNYAKRLSNHFLIREIYR